MQSTKSLDCCESLTKEERLLQLRLARTTARFTTKEDAYKQLEAMNPDKENKP